MPKLDLISYINVILSAVKFCNEMILYFCRLSSVPPRFQDWSEQRNAEREAAIAAAAAATG